MWSSVELGEITFLLTLAEEFHLARTAERLQLTLSRSPPSGTISKKLPPRISKPSAEVVRRGARTRSSRAERRR